MKTKIGILLMVLGFVLMAAVAGRNLYLQRALPDVLAAIGENKSVTPPPGAVETISVSPAPTHAPNPEGITEVPSPTPAPTMKVVYAKNKPYVGTLQIPSLGLTLPVQAQWSYAKMKHTPCHYSGTAGGGNLVLIAHNYKSHFGNLKELAIGDEIIFTDADGLVYTYAVDAHETLQPNQNGYLTAGDWDLSLSTCTVGGTMREIVRCTIVSAP